MDKGRPHDYGKTGILHRFGNQMPLRAMIQSHIDSEFFCNADCCENIVHPVDMGF